MSQRSRFPHDRDYYVSLIVERVQVGAADECWPFMGSRLPSGHGRMNEMYAHRVAYEVWHPLVGELPGSVQVRHACDNPPCCNPHHLLLGTNRDNVNDKVARGRQTRGEQIHTARLTESDVRLIRNSPMTNAGLARRLGVGKSTVRDVRVRKTWAHVV